MEATEKKKGRKAAATTGAIALALILGLSGTFAWTSFSQRATNEAVGGDNPGGRLHDDFIFTADTKNKDIYVENFTDEQNGSPIYARVQLKEYMEYGKDAGSTDATKTNRTPVTTGATMADKDTWETHMFDGSNTNAATFSKYFTWTTGGSKSFIPTFNMNRNCLSADVKGSLHDTPNAYDGYAASLGSSQTGTEVKDIAESTSVCPIDGVNVTECEGTHGTLGDDYTETPDAVHNAKDTLAATETGAAGLTGLMSMDEYLAKGAKPGPYWVYDTDGWVYWAQAIEPGTATGLLLDKVDSAEKYGDTWYYGIEAIGEFVSGGEWKQDGGNYYFDGKGTKTITANAYKLLTNAGNVDKYDGVTITVGLETPVEDARVGSSMQWYTVIKQDGVETHDFDDEIEWTCEGGNGTATINESGVLTVPTTEKANNVITVWASIGGGIVKDDNYITLKGEDPTRWINDLKNAPTLMNSSVGASTVTIDNEQYLKLAESDGKVLVVAWSRLKDEQVPIDTTGLPFNYLSTTLRQNLNTTYLNSLDPELRGRIVPTQITSTGYLAASPTYTSTEKVFLPSLKDFEAIDSNVYPSVAAGEYTASGSIFPTSVASDLHDRVLSNLPCRGLGLNKLDDTGVPCMQYVSIDENSDWGHNGTGDMFSPRSLLRLMWISVA